MRTLAVGTAASISRCEKSPRVPGGAGYSVRPTISCCSATYAYIECCYAKTGALAAGLGYFRANEPAIRRDSQRRGARFRRQAAPRVRVAPAGTARGARRAAEGVRQRRIARFPSPDARAPRKRVAGRDAAEGSA